MTYQTDPSFLYNVAHSQGAIEGAVIFGVGFGGFPDSYFDEFGLAELAGKDLPEDPAHILNGGVELDELAGFGVEVFVVEAIDDVFFDDAVDLIKIEQLA